MAKERPPTYWLVQELFEALDARDDAREVELAAAVRTAVTDAAVTVIAKLATSVHPGDERQRFDSTAKAMMAANERLRLRLVAIDDWLEDRRDVRRWRRAKEYSSTTRPVDLLIGSEVADDFELARVDLLQAVEFACAPPAGAGNRQ